MLKIASALSLPLNAVTQTFAIIARKGGGKTYAATLMAEQMLIAGAQVIACDPVGNWYGLRLKADGKTESGLPIYIFGGEYADVPLYPEGGREIAQALATRPVSAILDVSRFRKAERERFMTAFAEEFFHLKKNHRTPVHLFIEEAQIFIPQQVTGDAAKMVGAFEDIVRLGRNYGIGDTLISQRPQSVNKQVLSQTECLIALQITGPHERKAVDEWVTEHEVDRKLVGELPSLAQGEAFFWSPGWLRRFERIRINKKTTYDASATPVVGAKIVRPAELTKKEIENLTEGIRQSIERAKADDPRELKAEITRLKRELAAKPLVAVDPAAIEKARKQGAESARREFRKVFRPFCEKVRRIAETFHASIPAQAEWDELDKVLEGTALQTISTKPARIIPKTDRSLSNSNGNLSGGERKILTVLVQENGCTKKKLALRAGYAIGGGGFNNYLSSLRSKGYLEGSDPLRPTGAGSVALGPYEPLPEGDALLEFWLRQLGKAERAILEAVAGSGHPMTKEQVASLAGYEANGGGFNNALSRLRTLELIEGKGELRASEELFG